MENGLIYYYELLQICRRCRRRMIVKGLRYYVVEVSDVGVTYGKIGSIFGNGKCGICAEFAN